jgi:MFS superfamily sulfate permease-like transporter
MTSLGVAWLVVKAAACLSVGAVLGFVIAVAAEIGWRQFPHFVRVSVAEWWNR